MHQFLNQWTTALSYLSSFGVWSILDTKMFYDVTTRTDVCCKVKLLFTCWVDYLLSLFVCACLCVRERDRLLTFYLNHVPTEKMCVWRTGIMNVFLHFIVLTIRARIFDNGNKTLYHALLTMINKFWLLWLLLISLYSLLLLLLMLLLLSAGC